MSGDNSPVIAKPEFVDFRQAQLRDKPGPIIGGICMNA